ncbi:gustatory receptor [Homalodisca vitripennis]|nr:gustatory receptor [Homalodisca vitripennis]
MRVLSKGALFFCQVFGGLPLKYTPESAGISRLIFSPLMIWWGVTVTVLQIVFICFECGMILMRYPSVLRRETDSNTTLFGLNVAILSIMLMGLVSFTSSARTYREFLKICTFLGQFDHTLQVESSDYWSTENVSIITISTAIPVILEGALHYSMSWKEEHDFLVRRIMVYFATMTAFCARTAMLIHFQLIAYGIANRFRLVNARIRLLVINESFRQNILRRNPPYVDRRQDYTSCKEFNILLRAYHLLCDAVYQANVFYGNLLLVCIFCTFITITEYLYFSFLIINEGEAYLDLFFSDATFLVMIALCGSHVSEMAGDTAPLIRKLINENVGSGLREELKSSLLQLAGTNVEFTAGGFFQINKQTVTSIAAAVTSYLVIMIQFETQSK